MRRVLAGQDHNKTPDIFGLQNMLIEAGKATQYGSSGFASGHSQSIHLPWDNNSQNLVVVSEKVKRPNQDWARTVKTSNDHRAKFTLKPKNLLSKKVSQQQRQSKLSSLVPVDDSTLVQSRDEMGQKYTNNSEAETMNSIIHKAEIQIRINSQSLYGSQQNYDISSKMGNTTKNQETFREPEILNSVRQKMQMDKPRTSLELSRKRDLLRKNRQRLNQVLPLEDSDVRLTFYQTKAGLVKNGFSPNFIPPRTATNFNPRELKSQRSDMDKMVHNYQKSIADHPYIDGSIKEIESIFGSKRKSLDDQTKPIGKNMSSYLPNVQQESFRVLKKANQQMLQKRSVHKSQHQILLQNVDSIQNMHKQNSQTSQRRTLYSQIEDQTNDLFQSNFSLLSRKHSKLVQPTVQLLSQQDSTQILLEKPEIPQETVIKNEDPYQYLTSNVHHRKFIKNKMMMRSQTAGFFPNKKQNVRSSHDFIQSNKQKAFQGNKKFSKSKILDIKSIKSEVFRQIDAKLQGKEIQEKEIPIESPMREGDIQKRILNQREIQKHWDKELDAQIRKAKLVNIQDVNNHGQTNKEKKEMKKCIHYQTYKHKERGTLNSFAYGTEEETFSPRNKTLVSDNDEQVPVREDDPEFEQFLLSMTESQREDYEKHVRDEIMEAVDDFLDPRNFERNLQEFQSELQIEQLQGCSSHIKSSLFVAKMVFKFGQVSDKLISSYIWERDRKKQVPKNPQMFREMVQDILNVEENEMLYLFLDKLKEEERNAYLKHKQPPAVKTRTRSIPRGKSSACEKLEERSDFYGDSENMRTVETVKRSSVGRQKTISWGRKSTLKTELVAASEEPNTATGRMRKNLTNHRNKAFMQKLAQYQKRLLDEFFDISEEIRHNDYLSREIQDPTIAENMDQVIENHLEKIMRDSDIYQTVNIATKKKQDLETVRINANQMSDFLKGKAAKKREQSLKEQKKLADASLVQMIFGLKRDALVLKFVQKLKKAVQVRRDETAQIQKENFIKEVIKKMDFNNVIKTTDLDNDRHKKITQDRNKIVDSIKGIFAKQINLNQNVNNIQVLIKKQVAETYDQEHQTQLKNLQEVIEQNKDEINQEDVTQLVENKLQEIVQENTRQNNQQTEQTQQTQQSQQTQQTQQTYQTQQTEEDESSADSLGDENDEAHKYRQSSPSKKVLRQYISQSLSKGQPPLPVLNRVQNGYLGLINYQLNDINSTSLAEASSQIVPQVLKKLYLINNSMKDPHIARLFQGLSQTEGIEGLGIINNGISHKAYAALCDQLLPSNGLRHIRKIILKDPTPTKICPNSLCRVFRSLQEHGPRFTQLKKLVFSKLGFDLNCAISISEAIIEMPKLRQLDISGNGLNGNSLIAFLTTIGNKSNLRSLNIGYNSSYTKNMSSHSYKFDQVLANFIHYQEELIHLDISGLGLSFPEIKHIAEKGIRKSRTLIAVHMDGLGLMDEELRELRQILKVLEIHSFSSVVNSDLRKRIHLGHGKEYETNEVFFNEQNDEAMDFMGKSNQRQEQNMRNQIKDKINSSNLQVSKHDKLVYQRVLGHPEMPLAHRWVEMYSNDCIVCNKMTYTVFVWNKKMAQDQLSNKRNMLKVQFYKQSNLEAIGDIYKHLENPLLMIRGHPIQMMIPLPEFMERLNQVGKNNIRNCNNEIEGKRYNDLSQIVDQNKKNKGSLWNERQQLLNPKYDGQGQDLSTWYQRLNKLLPSEFSQPVNLRSFHEKLDESYSTKLHYGLANETYLCGMFLPKSTLDIVIKHKSVRGVNFLRTQQKNIKHMSINRIDVNQKMIKKVKEIRHFKFPTSVFKNFQFDSDDLLEKAFQSDKELTKIHKFVKDKDEREKLYGVLRKYYGNLKNQFVSQIANVKSYPVIDWLDFVNACNSWGIVDKNLTQTDIDRIFIATNFEEEDLEENDDSSLCRFEFSEIIVRMARCKYCEKGTIKSIAEAVEHLLLEYILPNTVETMEWQPFREDLLWTLDVDDLFKANRAGIEKLYKIVAGKSKYLSKDDVVGMMQKACVPLSDEKTVVAYALSKYTLGNEMAEFDKYNQMLIQEFFEYLGRAAHLLYAENIPLAKKIERLLVYLLPLAKTEFKNPDISADIESESDYDDDWVDDFNQRVMNQYPDHSSDSD